MHLIKLFQQHRSANRMEICNDSLSLPSEINDHQDKLNMLATSLWTVNETIQQLLALGFQQIRLKQILKFTPNFVHSDFMVTLYEYINHSFPNYGTKRPSRLEEEDVSKMIKIQKDNLTPKQLPNQNPQKNQTVNDLPETLQALGSKRLSLTKRSSFMKRKQSQISQSPYGMVTERDNLSLRSSVIFPQKTIKQISTKKDPFLNFTSIAAPEHEDPEIVHLREKVHFNLKQKEKQQAIHSDRLKEDQTKIKSFNTQFGEKLNYTFDFDGVTMGSHAQNDQKINYYAMKVGVKTFNKKYRTIYKHLEDSNNGLNPNQQSIIRNKSSKVRDPALDTLDLQKSSSDIPVFEREQKVFVPQTEPSKLKILQYKRLYGKRFSRYDKESLTIEMSTLVDRKMTEDDFFTSKKHLTDSLSVKKSRSSSVNKEYTAKKIALPKIHGKYKILDRYQAIEIN